jgi:ferritin-like metal-binding protein YciE
LKELNHSLTALLHDAYCMEQAVESLLCCRIQERGAYPGFRQADEQHLVRTRRHKEYLSFCLQRYGMTPRAGQSVIELLLANRAPSATDAEGSLVDAMRLDYMIGQFEIITYQALIEAAAQTGDVKTLDVCEHILMEENRRANQISRNLPVAMAVHLSELALRPENGMTQAGRIE